ncbi:chromosomal replication initiator protein DnaA [Microbacter margulisiae]|uniref:Chromosomal replication initiator protein DnaA n=1 Tax=Microbacter margulisiae TaxID=1350067 RepID=A0A7W5DQA2_9PORP|nr:chromosomal replication initiator protein DnaA [Microbacter margulisiae]MBB3187042.1 chromosomal replication initiator protein [Microbacter margulisiae]
MKTNSANELWKRCTQVIRDNVSETTFSTWFAPIIPLSYENQVFTLQVPSQFFYEYIEETFVDLLRMTIHREVGEGTRLMYRVLVDRNAGTSTTIPSDEKVKPFASTPIQKENPFVRSSQVQNIDPQLNPIYNFNSFIEGNSNKLARTAGLSIAKDPGTTIFNPLFVYGPSGVGKTHLVHAIGVQTKQLHPEKRVLYVSANLFQIQYTDAVRNNTVNDFLNFYQSIDVLILDDIHEFAGKNGTQNTFFHIFNHLHQNGKQLVLTSDRSPVVLQGLEQRLLTRFKWGLSAEISQPDYELRKAILQHKIYKDGLDIPDDVVTYIAKNVVDNIRDLEGVIISLLAHSTLTNCSIDLKLAEKVIAGIVNIKPKTITIEHIRDVVCDHFGLKIEDMLSKRRDRQLAQARQIAMYLAKNYTQHSLSAIGASIGKRDHATVLHACKVVSDLMEIDKTYKGCIEEIQQKINA